MKLKIFRVKQVKNYVVLRNNHIQGLIDLNYLNQINIFAR
jgi:hypothetical protein